MDALPPKAARLLIQSPDAVKPMGTTFTTSPVEFSETLSNTDMIYTGAYTSLIGLFKEINIFAFLPFH